MKYGVVKKRESKGIILAERKMLGVHDVLRLDKERCIGCNICVKICPHEALDKVDAVLKDGRIIKKGSVNIKAEKCMFCGECAFFCPTNAIELLRNGKEVIPVVEAEAFPSPSKKIEVKVERCNPSCKLACEESCPTKAITVDAERSPSGEITKILRVNIDEKKCIFCKRCEVACPRAAIKVTRPLQGLIRLRTDLCFENCQACVDICPSRAITLGGDGKPVIEEQFCIYCGACQQVCPAAAVEVKITKVLYDQIKSAAWIAALEKLTSPLQIAKELNELSVRKKRGLIKSIDRY